MEMAHKRGSTRQPVPSNRSNALDSGNFTYRFFLLFRFSKRFIELLRLVFLPRTKCWYISKFQKIQSESTNTRSNLRTSRSNYTNRRSYGCNYFTVIEGLIRCQKGRTESYFIWLERFPDPLLLSCCDKLEVFFGGKYDKLK